MQQEGKYNTKDVWKNYKELYCFYFTQIYIYTLNKVKQPGLTILPTLRDLDCLIKTLGPSMRNFLLNYWLGESKELSKWYRLYPLSLVISQKSPSLKTPYALNTEIREFDLCTFSLRTGFHYTKWCQTSYQGPEAIPGYDAWETEQWPEWQNIHKCAILVASYLDCSQQLSNWT